jgi:NADPH2:quinone reductase
MKNVTVRFFVVYNLPSTDRASAETELARLLASDALQHNIAARYSLDDIVAAHDAVELGRVNGNVIVSLLNG